MDLRAHFERSRFQGGGHSTRALGTVLFDDFNDLSSARKGSGRADRKFFEGLEGGFFNRSFSYTNNQGRKYVEIAAVAVSHFFNHQTHHRGQVHGMLSQTTVAPPASSSSSR
jgi:uncharacterized damage-inducible protein DinB